jgi:type II secretory pathway pseudopilin PulG
MGDTIIEVLIAIAVVSSMLGAAFAVTNHSLLNARQAQEHEEALKLLEGQFEQLNELAINPSNQPSSGVKFCLSGLNVKLDPDPACTVGNVPGGYHLQITRTTTVSNDLYTGEVNWDGPTGGNDNVSIVYGLYR